MNGAALRPTIDAAAVASAKDAPKNIRQMANIVKNVDAIALLQAQLEAGFAATGNVELYDIEKLRVKDEQKAMEMVVRTLNSYVLLYFCCL